MASSSASGRVAVERVGEGPGLPEHGGAAVGAAQPPAATRRRTGLGREQASPGVPSPRPPVEAHDRRAAVPGHEVGTLRRSPSPRPARAPARRSAARARVSAPGRGVAGGELQPHGLGSGRLVGEGRATGGGGDLVDEQLELGVRQPAGADQHRGGEPARDAQARPSARPAGASAGGRARPSPAAPASSSAARNSRTSSRSRRPSITSAAASGCSCSQRLDLDPARRVELAVDVGLEVGVGDRSVMPHLTTRKGARRSAARACGRARSPAAAPRAPGQPRHQRAHRDAQDLGRVLVGEALQRHEHQHLALLLRQGHQRRHGAAELDPVLLAGGDRPAARSRELARRRRLDLPRRAGRRGRCAGSRAATAAPGGRAARCAPRPSPGPAPPAPDPRLGRRRGSAPARSAAREAAVEVGASLAHRLVRATRRYERRARRTATTGRTRDVEAKQHSPPRRTFVRLVSPPAGALVARPDVVGLHFAHGFGHECLAHPGQWRFDGPPLSSRWARPWAG